MEGYHGHAGVCMVGARSIYKFLFSYLECNWGLEGQVQAILMPTGLSTQFSFGGRLGEFSKGDC